MSNEQEEIMTKQDIALLVASFPDLKNDKNFPEEPNSESVLKYMSDRMKECGVEGRPSEILEYLAVAAAMKMIAQASLGQSECPAYSELDKQKTQESTALSAIRVFDRVKTVYDKGLHNNPEYQTLANDDSGFFPKTDEDIQKRDDAKIVKSVFGVNQSLRESIATMDFRTAVAMYPVQSYLSRNMEQGFEVADLDNSNDLTNLATLPMLGGNETSARDLNSGEFSRTAGYRFAPAVNDSRLFSDFAGLHLMTNNLQVRSTLALSEQFPHLKSNIEQNRDFYTNHAIETLAVCHAVEEKSLTVSKADTLNNMIEDPQTKDFAYSQYVPLHQFYLYGADVSSAHCPLVYGKVDGRYSLPSRISEVNGGAAFMQNMAEKSDVQVQKKELQRL